MMAEFKFYATGPGLPVQDLRISTLLKAQARRLKATLWI